MGRNFVDYWLVQSEILKDKLPHFPYTTDFIPVFEGALLQWTHSLPNTVVTDFKYQSQLSSRKEQCYLAVVDGKMITARAQKLCSPHTERGGQDFYMISLFAAHQQEERYKKISYFGNPEGAERLISNFCESVSSLTSNELFTLGRERIIRAFPSLSELNNFSSVGQHFSPSAIKLYFP